MASSSTLFSVTAFLPHYNSKSSSTPISSLSFGLHSSKSLTSLCGCTPSFKVLAEPEHTKSVDPISGFKATDDPLSEFKVTEGLEVEESSSSALVLEGDAFKAAPKLRIRIRLRSYWAYLIEDSCKMILEAARSTNAKTVGPVPLPTKRIVFCVLKSPHVHKDARTHIEIRTHNRLVDILYPTSQTIQALMKLDIPFGVDVKVKL